MLTLKTRNCDPGEVREHIRLYREGRRRLLRRQAFANLTTSASTIELTLGRDGLAHVHSHVWCSWKGADPDREADLKASLPLMWAESRRLDYLPDPPTYRDAVSRDDVMVLFRYVCKEHITGIETIAAKDPGFLRATALQMIRSGRLFEPSGELRGVGTGLTESACMPAS